MKPFACKYDYVHPETGTQVRGTIEADTRAELREHMQAEMEASGGALTPENFTSPALASPLEARRAPYVPVEKLEEANRLLKAAGLPEVKPIAAEVVKK